jgi:Zn-dependent peptidase ImmA (M78 family)
MYAYTEEHGGVMAINRAHPPEMRRHSMAHEYGHFLTDRFRPEITVLGRYERRPATERFADAFGRALLMPAASVRRRFHELLRQRSPGRENDRGGRPTVGDLFRSAHSFYVSLEAMTLRLEDLRLVAPGTWEGLRLRRQGLRLGDAWSFLGLREHPVDDERLPSRYRYLAAEAWQRGELSEGQLASFLRVDRVTARQVVQGLGVTPGARARDGDGGLDLFAPLSVNATG